MDPNELIRSKQFTDAVNYLKHTTPPSIPYQHELVLGSKIKLFVKQKITDTRAELHETEGDLWCCMEGNALFHVGGTLEGKKELVKKARTYVANHITGGKKVTLAKGDWLYIPAGQPHQHWITKKALLLVVKIPTPLS